MTLDIESSEIQRFVYKKRENVKKSITRSLKFFYIIFAIEFIISLIFDYYKVFLFSPWNYILFIIFLIFLVYPFSILYRNKYQRSVLKEELICELYDAELYLQDYRNGKIESLKKAKESLYQMKKLIMINPVTPTGFESSLLKDALKLFLENLDDFIKGLDDPKFENIVHWENKFSSWRGYLLNDNFKDFYEEMKKAKSEKGENLLRYIYKKIEMLNITSILSFLISFVIVLMPILIFYLALPSSRNFLLIAGSYASIILLAVFIKEKLIDKLMFALKRIPPEQKSN